MSVAGLLPPARLVAPEYTDPKTPPKNERTHQTIDPIRQASGLSVETLRKVGDEDTKVHGKTLGETLAGYTGVTLVCCEPPPHQGDALNDGDVAVSAALGHSALT